MRADRLLSILLILQNRGKQTAAGLARELEVSPRTIYRDIEALGTAGVPVYADLGPGGGFALLDSYRTTLTGLNETELRALFSLSLPGRLADLGLAGPLRAAMLKISAGMPEAQRQQEQSVRQRLHLDAAGWFQPMQELTLLPVLQTAVWQDQVLRIGYQRGTRRSRRLVEAYALVAKAGVWYLVARPLDGSHELRVYRVARLQAAAPSGDHFERPADFDLARFWRDWVAEYEASLPRYPVRLAVAPELAGKLPGILGSEVRGQLAQAERGADGWLVIEHTFERLEQARAYVLGLGDRVRVLQPLDLRESVAAYARQVARLYSSG